MNDEENKKKDLTVEVEDEKLDFKTLSQKRQKPSKADQIATIVMTIICVVLCVYFIYTATRPKASAAIATGDEATVINVEVTEAVSGTFTKTTKVNGEISSDATSVSVFPDAASGHVTSILVKRGDQVQKGDVIAYVDPSRPGQTYNVSPVVSPIDGEVTAVTTSVGSLVSASTPIATLVGDKTLYAQASVPEKYLSTLQLGNTATLNSVAYPDDKFDAVITYISPNVSSVTRTVDIELALGEGAEKLKEGMFITVNLVTEQQEDVIMVPTQSLNKVMDAQVVYVVENGIAKQVTIETGSSNDDVTVITSGLKTGDQVVTAGSVNDGSAVKIFN